MFSHTLLAKDLYIVSSGFNSCQLLRAAPTPYNTGVYASYYKTITDGSPYIFSCFTGLIGKEKLYYITSDHPQDAKPISISAFFDLVQSFYEAKKISENLEGVKIWGHSHGGWLALQTTINLGEVLPIKGLMTVDPISYKLCSRKTLTENQSQNLGKLTAWPFQYSYKLNKCILT
jgi:hypothetical protein